MKLTLNWHYNDQPISLVRDQVITRFALRKVKRKDNTECPYMEAFMIGKPVEVHYNGKVQFSGDKGDYLIVTDKEMYIMKGKSFESEFEYIVPHERNFKADMATVVIEDFRMPSYD